LDLGLAIAGRVAQLPDRAGRHEQGTDQLVLDQLVDPGGIGHVGLAAGHVTQVGGVEQPTLDLTLEQLPDRLPLAAGRLHPDPGHPKLASHWASSTSPAVVVVTLRVSA
jgi:hypothetical protein